MNKKNTQKNHCSLLITHCSLFIIMLLVVCSPLSALSLDETLAAVNSVSNNIPAQFRWDPFLRNGVISSGDHFAVFNVAQKNGDSGYLLLNNRELFNVPSPVSSGGSLDFPQAFVDILKASFARLLENDASRFRVAAIVIDPGHGGKDPGAVDSITINGKKTPVYEKEIVIGVGLALRDRLNETFPDKKIIMTRDNDAYLTLEQRADIANAVQVKDNESVIFISIHANRAANVNARGYEVWHITENQRRNLITPGMSGDSSDIDAIRNALLNEEFAAESKLLADAILRGFGQIFGSALPSRGRKANDWFVVRNSKMPAVLVELGFISNREDSLLMTNPEGLQKFTDSLYNGIVDFIGIFER